MLMRSAAQRAALLVLILFAVAVAACGKKTPPVARATPPPTAGGRRAGRGPAAARATRAGARSDRRAARAGARRQHRVGVARRPQPQLADQTGVLRVRQQRHHQRGQATLDANAVALKKYSSWTITIEGHSDERGTAEYNLALGERRAVAARAYLVSLGIPGDRLRTVSYGKEFPFDPGHDDTAWSKNRRAHFVITAK